MMMHQIGKRWSWCQQKSNEIKECCWHQGRILPRWCSIFPRLPSHQQEKASKWYSMGMSGGGNHIHARMTLHGLNRSGHPACSVPSALPTLHRFYECRYADDNHRWSRYFTNLLYPNRMALGFFTVSFPGESMTLSLVTLAQYYPSKIPIFDAKPLISEVVTLSLLCFSSANHLLSQSRRRILNVTESDIS